MHIDLVSALTQLVAEHTRGGEAGEIVDAWHHENKDHPCTGTILHRTIY